MYEFDLSGFDWDELSRLLVESGVNPASEPAWGPAVADPDTAFVSPQMATTQPAASTGAVAADAPWTPTWTDIGGISAPTIRYSDLGVTKAWRPDYYPTGDQEIGGFQPGYEYLQYGHLNASPYASLYGAWGAPGRNGGLTDYSNNYQLLPVSETAFDVRIKTGDKEGTTIRYVRDGDYWVPQANLGTSYWNTNNDGMKDLIGVASVLGMGFGAEALFGAGLAGAGAGTAAADAFALSDAVYGASQFGYGAGAAGAAGAVAAEEAALATLGATAEEAAAAGFTWNAAEGAWIAPQTVITGTAPAAIGAGEIAAGVGAAGTAATLPGNTPYEPFENNYPYDEPFENNYPPSDPPPTTEPPPPFEENFIPSDANPVSGPDPWSIPPGAQKVIDWAIDHPGAVMTGVGVVGGLLEDPDSGNGGGGTTSGGVSAPIQQYAIGRSYTPAPEGYRPGFSPEHQYINYAMSPRNAAPVGGTAPEPDIPPPPPGPDYAVGGPVGGGITRLAQPRHTKGPGDGMSDSIPATIDGRQRAALSNDEFVIPADVVSHLGNGSSEAGAKVLYAMMDRIRQARTGKPQQARQINPRKVLPA